MSAQEMKLCPQCNYKNLVEAKFCNNCGFRFRADIAVRPAAAPAAPPAHAAPPAAPVHAAAGHDAHDEEESGHDAHKSHPSDKFYLGVFGLLAVITLVELAFTSTNNHALRIGALVPLSIAKFALVVMFFMHLKGDKKVFQMLFVGPLFIGAGVLLSLVALFSKFKIG